MKSKDMKVDSSELHNTQVFTCLGVYSENVSLAAKKIIEKEAKTLFMLNCIY